MSEIFQTTITDPWFLLFLAASATFVWRALGVALAGRIDPEGRVFDWVNAVAYAMVAGLMMRIILFPTGTLVDAPMMDRMISVGIAFAVWALMGRALLQGLFAGVLAFAGFTLWRAGHLPF